MKGTFALFFFKIFNPSMTWAFEFLLVHNSLCSSNVVIHHYKLDLIIILKSL